MLNGHDASRLEHVMRAAAIVLATLLTACAPREQELDDVREATFRHLFTRNGSAHPESAGVYCLSIDGQDPADHFMSRFAGNKPSAKKKSLCSVSPTQGVRDNETGQRGLAFGIEKVTLKWGSRAEVECGYYEHGFSAEGYTYDLEKVGGLWKVVRAVQRGPSV